MANELTPMATFEEKVKGRLKETIADMLPDEVLTSLVQRVMEEQFFTEKVTTDRNGYRKVDPPWFAVEVMKLAEPILQKHIEAAFAAHKDKIEEAVKAFVDQQNLALLMSAKIAEGMTAGMFQHAQRIVDQVQRRY